MKYSYRYNRPGSLAFINRTPHPIADGAFCDSQVNVLYFFIGGMRHGNAEID